MIVLNLIQLFLYKNSEIFNVDINRHIYILYRSMKALPILLFAVLSLSFIVIAPLSIGSSYALKDKDGVYDIVTIDNVKGKSLEVTAYIYDEDKSKKIKHNGLLV